MAAMAKKFGSGDGDSDSYEYTLPKFLLLVATLVAMATYFAAFNPLGGVYPDTDHVADDPILRSTGGMRYLFFYNATAFACSLVVIVLLLIHDKGGRMARIAASARSLRVVLFIDLLSLMGAFTAGTWRDALSTVFSLVLTTMAIITVVSLDVLRDVRGASIIEHKFATLLALCVLTMADYAETLIGLAWEWLGKKIHKVLKLKSLSDWLEKRRQPCFGGENPQGCQAGNAENTSDSPIQITDPPSMELEEELVLPLSAGKMATAIAVSSVDRAYSLDALTDDSRQTLLQKLRNFQADLDRAEDHMTQGSLALDPNLFRNVSSNIWQFRTAVEEIEDAIDEIDYRRMEEEAGNNPISKFVKSNFFNKVTRFDSNLNNRLRKALGSFQNNHWTLIPVPLPNLITAPSSAGRELYGYPSWLATAEGVRGREWKKEDLLQDLLQWLTEDTTEGVLLPVCSLIWRGLRGIGKDTEFANKICQDPRVLAHFDFVVWVPLHVIHFNIQEIVTIIIEKVHGKPPQDSEMSFLENMLQELLQEKKVLLILSNMFKVDAAAVYNFKMLVTTLKDCTKGSKILITTRDQSVVDMVGYTKGAAAHHVIYSGIRFPGPVDSKNYPQRNQRYPSWISNGGAFGRDREREQIVQWLTMDTAEDEPFSVYAVIGMAGMGKTTLANMVRQDHRVLANFKYVVWVPVSSAFDTKQVTRFILETVAGRSSYFSTKKLRYAKLLLILDDVWEDSSADNWEKLMAPLKICKKGSKILLTTRMQSVVDMAARAVRSQVKYLRVEELNEYDNLMLFKSYLPSHVDSEDYDNLILIGEQILKKIGGCPLVTSLVASWLGSHMDTSHWNIVLQKGWKHLDAKHIVLSSLRLSYDCLPTELQTCFRYCSLFPERYKFKKVELAKMWIGSGLIPFNSSKLENVGIQKTKYVDFFSAIGEEYFEVLTRKSFFCRMLETETSDGNQQEYYVLHGLMHDLAQHVSKGECARVDGGGLHGISIRTRHLSISPCCNLWEICRLLEDIYRNHSSTNSFTNLRTLIIQIESGLDRETDLVLGELLKKSRSLRLLYLGAPSLFHTHDSISSLIHLRYLFLFSCDEYHLQKVFELYHLQVCKLEYLTAKGANSIDIQSLRCLRSLHVPDNTSSMIQNIGRLTLLQELHGFEVVENGGRRLSELGHLRSLYQLTLRNLQNVLKIQEAADIKLKERHHLKLLSLSWNKHLKGQVDHDGMIINSLEPNKEIQLLHIHGYSGVKLPVWIENSSFIHLVSLEIEYCTKWKNLPSLKGLTSLKHLKLENLFQLEYIGIVPEQQFEATESENDWLPPLLSTLTVRWCPNLKELPAIPCTLELLIIKHVHIIVLPGILQNYSGSGGSSPPISQLGVLHIESCSQLTSLNKGLLQQQEQLHSLKTLVLKHCERLHHLPTRGFTELHQLNSLEIVACPILRDVKAEDHLYPISLRNLDLNPCCDIDVTVLMSLQNLITLRRLTIFNCSNVVDLPSADVFRTLKNLNDVSIARCRNMLSLGGLGAVASLRLLSILCCNKLTPSYPRQDICTFKLQKLTVDRQALLLVEPLRSLRHTSELHINDDFAMDSLPGKWLLQNAASLHSVKIGVADSLHSLPSEIEKLVSLQSLHIERAPLLQSLPQLPASLSKLTIWGCDPWFIKSYERDIGSEWGKIAHIANMDIQAISEGMNYTDDDQSHGLATSTGNPYRKYIVIE